MNTKRNPSAQIDTDKILVVQSELEADKHIYITFFEATGENPFNKAFF